MIVSSYTDIRPPVLTPLTPRVSHYPDYVYISLSTADPDTVAMMHKPRCSLPDIIMTSAYQRLRRKRYAPSGSVWQKRHLTWR